MFQCRELSAGEIMLPDKHRFDAFALRTATGSKVKARGTNMAKVDEPLQAYWLDIGTTDAPGEIGLLTNLVVACLGWLKTKKDKSEFKKNFFGMETNYFNTLFRTRRAAIQELGNDALNELDACLRRHGLLDSDRWGKINFDRKKLRTLGGPRTGTLKSMGHDYRHERTTYLSSGKTKAISGSGVHSTHGSLQTWTRPDMLKEFVSIHGRDLSVSKAVKVAKKDVHTLTQQDFQMFDEIGRVLGTTGDVNYLKKGDRYKYIAIVDGHGALRDYNDALITTNDNKVTAYAMDEYGNFFCKDADPLNGAYYFNHSSFNAGKDVISAGTLTITAGILKVIDNNSGHYKPTRENLHSCITVLAQDNCDLTQAVVNLYVFPGGVKTEHRFHAAAFLANPNSAPFLVT
ncbi:MAG: hypothetical protein B7X65_16130 [Polaromonas sp. 39-63-25]|nr:MAG: hypothetical protein B7Y09_17435 [Polaromonas sp. 24-63-21]OZA48199.1 MAG: hypothetical protein B7X88_19465 [Polaromonas sp. 17-63-33]OZA86726.1 MAG: hypothetical protein B7X65_16130 [Polaromonas sp. 39-63-25]